MAGIPKIHSGSSSPIPKPEGMARAGMEAMEITQFKGLGAIEKNCEQIDTCLNRLSKENISVRDPFDPKQPERKVSQATYPEGVKAAKRVFSNQNLNQQMNFAIGSHRRK